MYLQNAMALLLIISVTGLILWFFKKKRAMFYVHSQNILDLESNISKNRFQINFRNNSLNKYDFLKFNLNEALTVQPEIHT